MSDPAFARVGVHVGAMLIVARSELKETWYGESVKTLDELLARDSTLPPYAAFEASSTVAAKSSEEKRALAAAVGKSVGDDGLKPNTLGITKEPFPPLLPSPPVLPKDNSELLNAKRLLSTTHDPGSSSAAALDPTARELDAARAALRAQESTSSPNCAASRRRWPPTYANGKPGWQSTRARLEPLSLALLPVAPERLGVTRGVAALDPPRAVRRNEPGRASSLPPGPVAPRGKPPTLRRASAADPGPRRRDIGAAPAPTSRARIAVRATRNAQDASGPSAAIPPGERVLAPRHEVGSLPVPPSRYRVSHTAPSEMSSSIASPGYSEPFPFTSKQGRS